MHKAQLTFKVPAWLVTLFSMRPNEEDKKKESVLHIAYKYCRHDVALSAHGTEKNDKNLPLHIRRSGTRLLARLLLRAFCGIACFLSACPSENTAPCVNILPLSMGILTPVCIGVVQFYHIFKKQNEQCSFL